MKLVAKAAAGAAAATLVLLTASVPASAEPPEQWWTDIFSLAEVHKTTQGEGSIVCVVDGAINADVPEFDGADLQLKSAGTGGGEFENEIGPAKSYSSAFYADHGTSMTALIIGQGSGTGPSGSGIAGMAPQATVFFYGVDPDPTTEETANAFDSLINQGLKDGCEIFSISYTGISVFPETLGRLNEAKAIVLFGGPTDPEVDNTYADLNGTLVIGASDRDSKAWTDDKQPELPDLVAPGVDIISGGNVGTATDSQWDSSIVNSGSSDATAITAGVLALVKAKYPDATGNQLIQSMLHSVGGAKNWESFEDTGWGPVSMKDMLARDPSGWPDINPMLMNRQEILETFPESVWQDPAAPATEEPDPAQAGAEATTTAPSDETAIPAWAWGVGALVLIGAAGATVIVIRRRSTSTGTGA